MPHMKSYGENAWKATKAQVSLHLRLNITLTQSGMENDSSRRKASTAATENENLFRHRAFFLLIAIRQLYC